MSALAAARTNIVNKGTAIGTAIGYKAAASQTFYDGALVALNSAGYLIPASTVAGIRVVGIVDLAGQGSVVSSATLGATVLSVRTGIFPFASGTSTDAVTIADLGNDVYALDDQTVSRLPGAGRAVVGELIKVEGTNFYVGIGFSHARAGSTLAGAAGTAWQGLGSVEDVAAPGACSVLTHISRLTAVDGTDAFTLAAGLFKGQPKVVIVSVAGTNTPIGTVTFAPASTPATVTALGVLGDSWEGVWDGALWQTVSSAGATFT